MDWLNWINSLEKIDELPELKLIEAPKEEVVEPKKVFLTDEQREKWAIAIVDSALELYRKRVGEFEIDIVCRQFMIDVIDHAYELGIAMPWSMYVRIILNYMLEGMENKSDALVVAFLIGIAYANLMEDEDIEKEDDTSN